MEFPAARRPRLSPLTFTLHHGAVDATNAIKNFSSGVPVNTPRRKPLPRLFFLVFRSSPLPSRRPLAFTSRGSKNSSSKSHLAPVLRGFPAVSSSVLWASDPGRIGSLEEGEEQQLGRRRSAGEEMAGGKEPIEVRFRLFDGTDIGPSKYDPSTTVSALKELILARWPQDKDIAPKTVNDLKLINAGRILENNRTLAESRVPVGEVPGSVITMHVVVRPPQADKNSEKQLANSPKQNRCGCTIL